MTIEIRPVDGCFAAEVLGADIGANDDATFAAVRTALLDHGVIVIRDQTLPPEIQVAFSRRFGTVEGRRPSASDGVLMKGLPEITLLSNRREKGELIGNADAGRYWHSDQSFQEKPNLATLVYALEIPDEGGDTLFADLVGAYETLPKATRRRIEGRRAAHTFAKHYHAIMAQGSTRPPLTPEQLAELKEMWHPVVRTLPETGRKSLFINPGHTTRIEGMDEAESRDLLEDLFAHCLRPENVYRHQWRLGDAVFWDNRAVMHKAETYDMTRYTRHMHRTSIHGDRPV
jgi:taurine dioxygenase